MIAYDDGRVRLHHADSREHLEELMREEPSFALVTDPPYGIKHASGQTGPLRGRGIEGDADTHLRDWAVELANGWDAPSLVFGTWKMPRPLRVRTILIWDKGMGVGMGDLAVPWKPNWEEIYVIGGRAGGFVGPRDDGVLKGHVMVSWVSKGREHPNQKPIDLMQRLLLRIDPERLIIDPFCGSGATLIAAKALGRRAVGFEIDAEWIEAAKRGLAQDNLLTPEPSYEQGELAT